MPSWRASEVIVAGRWCGVGLGRVRLQLGLELLVLELARSVSIELVEDRVEIGGPRVEAGAHEAARRSSLAA